MMISDNGWDYSWTRQPQTYDDGASSSHGTLQLQWPDQGLVLHSRDTPDKDGHKHRINIFDDTDVLDDGNMATTNR
jgi:hypothetical protein